jgi:hypothetical protein
MDYFEADGWQKQRGESGVGKEAVLIPAFKAFQVLLSFKSQWSESPPRGTQAVSVGREQRVRHCPMLVFKEEVLAVDLVYFHGVKKRLTGSPAGLTVTPRPQSWEVPPSM